MNHRVGVLGTGNMGFPISKNIAEDGHDVVVYDILYDATVEKYKGTAIKVARSPREMAEAADVVLFVVKDTTITEKAIDCENGLLDGLNGKKIFVDLTTSDPAKSAKLGERIIQAGAKYIDIPMTGGQIGAIERKLVMMGSGEKTVFDEVKYIFERISKNLFYLGTQIGAGHMMKLIHNQLSHATFLATCESIYLGKKYGMDPKDMIDVLNVGNARSVATEVKFPKFVLTGKDAGFTCAMGQKDIGLVLEKGKEKGVMLPYTKVTYDYWTAPCDEGKGEMDYARMVEYLEQKES
jgi:3-hydroxyisobutyrate dehydrogenase-like beta-hydroxyacid dehydrogenase